MPTDSPIRPRSAARLLTGVFVAGFIAGFAWPVDALPLRDGPVHASASYVIDGLPATPRQSAAMAGAGLPEGYYRTRRAAGSTKPALEWVGAGQATDT